MKSGNDNLDVKTTSEHKGIKTTMLSIVMVMPKDRPKPGIMLFCFILLFLVNLVEVCTVSEVNCSCLSPASEVIYVGKSYVVIDPSSVFGNCLYGIYFSFEYEFAVDFFIKKRRNTPSFSYGDISRNKVSV